MTFSLRLVLLATLMGFSLGISAQKLTIKLPNCQETLYEFRFNGVTFVKTQPIDGNQGIYEFPNKAGSTRLTYLGTERGNPLPILLDGKESFSISGNCADLSSAVIIGSPVNDRYQQLKKELGELKQAANRQTMSMRLSPANSPAFESAKSELKRNDEQRLAKLQELEHAGEDFFAAMAAADLYTSFANTEKPYDSELNYFVNERFQWADFSKPGFRQNPWVFESFREFVKTLVDAQVPAEMLKDFIDTQLALVVNFEEVHPLALGAVFATLNAEQNPLGAHYGKEYVRRYGDKEPEARRKLESDIKRLAALEGGAIAPEFKQQALAEGQEFGPQDFKGQILLIDFWASWCGPCRRENPNVVAMYKEFKDQGFEILGVSLDRDKASWEAAIQADQLTWKHVSDLKGWQNAAAQLYGVRSIPATILLDREGRIVARNLRGEALRAKVAELVAGKS